MGRGGDPSGGPIPRSPSVVAATPVRCGGCSALALCSGDSTAVRSNRGYSFRFPDHSVAAGGSATGGCCASADPSSTAALFTSARFRFWPSVGLPGCTLCCATFCRDTDSRAVTRTASCPPIGFRRSYIGNARRCVFLLASTPANRSRPVGYNPHLRSHRRPPGTSPQQAADLRPGLLPVPQGTVFRLHAQSRRGERRPRTAVQSQATWGQNLRHRGQSG